MKNQNDLIELGYAHKSHGIKGGVVFVLHAEEESILDVGSKIHLFPYKNSSKLPPAGKVFIIEEISFGNKVIVYLVGIHDKNQIDELLPFVIKVPRSELPETEDGQYYVADMLGLDVYEHGTNKKIGILKDFYENGAQVVFVIKRPEGYLDLPFVNSFFPVVDMEKKRVEIVLPQYVQG